MHATQTAVSLLFLTMSLTGCSDPGGPTEGATSSGTATITAQPGTIRTAALKESVTVEAPEESAATEKPISLPDNTPVKRADSFVDTPLDKYVATEDSAFSYDATSAKIIEDDAYTARVYSMTSQNWLDKSRVTPNAWKHWVTIVVPNEVEGDTALLLVSGGGNKKKDAPLPDIALSQVAVLMKSILVEVKQIPNQPLRFAGERAEEYKEQGRSEDALIAFGWDKYLRDGDPLWLPRLPMTKAVVRAMDLAQAEQPRIKKFVVSGASKRGWTTWTVAAVGPRVAAIVRAVIDVLNVASNLDNHLQAYGFWAPAVGDYKALDILSRRHTPEFDAMMAVVDPYRYIDRLTMPKYIVNSAGDQFFPSDSWKFYFDDLKGEKYLRYMANTDHGLSLEAFFNLASFHHAICSGTPRPRFTWKLEAKGALELRCETEPTSVLLWQATNPKARDFRKESLGPVWKDSVVKPEADGAYRAALANPAQGWTAFFLEMEFPNPDFAFPFKFTTGISIVPDRRPLQGKRNE